MTTTNPVDGISISAVICDLDYLIEAWPHVVGNRIPGTDRSWVEEPRKAVVSEADLERMGKQGIPRPAPVRVGVLDLLQQYAARSEEMARCIVEVLALGANALDDAYDRGEPWEYRRTDGVEIARRWFERYYLPESAASKDPRPWLRTLRRYTEDAHDADDKTAPWLAAMIAPLVDVTARLLGDVRAGQVMNAVCPYCLGRTARGWIGERTLTIEFPDAKSVEPMVVCHGLECDPPSSSCGTRVDNQPAWPRREWDWLASQLLPATNNERIGA
ncbi:hypothetical protein [Cellulomonas sp. NPDC058312]|uniref:hypothetical protein n=1 Tax=Cellulomonas sp. NPDC058312 TaxID=3346441 RepID=UPI0036F02307